MIRRSGLGMVSRIVSGIASGIVLGIAVAAVLVGASMVALNRPPRFLQKAGSDVAEPPATPHPQKAEPTLFCDFYNVMHNATVASFYFSVGRTDGPEPTFYELFVVGPDGNKTEFGGDDTPYPVWAYRSEDGTPAIRSPDGSTGIILYGLKPWKGRPFWIEAGLRSDEYRNLEGQCRQAL